MKAQQIVPIIFVFMTSYSHAMQQAPQNKILLHAIMKNVFSIEKNCTDDGAIEYTATLIHQDLLVCKKNQKGIVQADYLLYLHNPNDRKKVGGNYYEKFYLEGISNQPLAVLEIMQKKYTEQNNTITKFCHALN